MKEELYISLLYKKLSGQLRPDEATALNDWLDNAAENRSIAASVEKAWTLSGDYERKDVKIDLDADFADLEKKMDEVEETTTISRKTIAKKRNLPPKRNWLNIAAALVILVSVGFLLRNYFIDSLQEQRISIGVGETKALTLGDGTKIWVNENSTISYPGVFDKKERRVTLSGEAFFEVTENPAQPFIIKTTAGEVKVLGTSFNVRDYPKEKEMQVEVLTGKVQFSMPNEAGKLILTPNERGILNKKDKRLRKATEQFGNAAFWHTNKLVFTEQALEDVLQELEERFAVNIELSSSEMKKCPFTSTFDQKTLPEILKVIESVFGMKMDVKNNTNYTLFGGLCP